ncbi:hypothetical protein [Micromonospora sp. WMMD737]|uniref:hypothetical protein n=1 Tax=Micromonospora sp. WMMD737 TaxID=3404113 RepID=UPI003B95445D
MSAESENLSNLFGTSAAATVAAGISTLAGRLPDRGRTSAVDETTSASGSASASQVAQRQHQADPAESASKARVENRVRSDDVVDADDDVDDDDDLAAQISVYVLPAVVTTVRRNRKGRTNAQVAFEAITALRDRLPELVASHRTASVKPAAGVGPFAPQAGDRGNSGPRRVLWTFKATGRNQRVLDQIVDEAGATSRSELVAAALEAHLLRRRRRPS